MMPASSGPTQREVDRVPPFLRRLTERKGWSTSEKFSSA